MLGEKKGTFVHNGKRYNVTGDMKTWSAEAQAAFKAIIGNHDQCRPMCDFKIECPLIGTQKWCGGIPPYQVQQKPAKMGTYFILYELLSQKTDTLKPGQLNFFTDNKLYRTGNIVNAKHQWWVSYYWCGKGLKHAIDRAKSNTEVYGIYVTKVTKKYRKKPTKKIIYRNDKGE